MFDPPKERNVRILLRDSIQVLFIEYGVDEINKWLHSYKCHVLCIRLERLGPRGLKQRGQVVQEKKEREAKKKENTNNYIG